MDLTVQLPDSNLNFESYTEFKHSCISCHNFVISKSYDDFTDLDKIDALELKFEEHSDDDSDVSSNGEDTSARLSANFPTGKGLKDLSFLKCVGQIGNIKQQSIFLHSILILRLILFYFVVCPNN